MRILIVGAGPTGLSAAVELARHGITADIIDRRENPSNLSRAVGITPNSLKLLETSGATGALLKQGIKIRNATFYSTTKKTLALPIKNTDAKYGFLLALPQDKTESILRDIYEGHGNIVQYGTSFTALTQDEGGVDVELTAGGGAAPTKARYDYVVGADGIESSVRQAVGLAYNGYDLPETWSIADVDAKDWRHPVDFTACVLDQGRIVIVAPIGEGRFRVVSNTPNAIETLPLPLNVTHTHREGQFTISIRQVPNFSSGRVYLAGDAAHCHSPVGGRGMNLGIADAVELASRFKSDTLDGYSAVRHAEAAQTIDRTERARRFITSHNAGKKALLGLGLGLVNRVPALQSRMARAVLTA